MVFKPSGQPCMYYRWCGKEQVIGHLFEKPTFPVQLILTPTPPPPPCMCSHEHFLSPSYSGVRERCTVENHIRLDCGVVLNDDHMHLKRVSSTTKS